jgi:hypothetical protein
MILRVNDQLGLARDYWFSTRPSLNEEWSSGQTDVYDKRHPERYSCCAVHAILHKASPSEMQIFDKCSTKMVQSYKEIRAFLQKKRRLNE